MSKKKVAIVSPVMDVVNYGTVLQAYALQEIVKENYSDALIVYYPHRELKKQLLRIFNFTLLKIKIKQIYRLRKIKRKKSYKEYEFLKRNAFRDFINKNLYLSEKIKNRKSLENYINQYNCVIVGSDQVWNPTNLGRDYFTLNFVPDNIIKVAYAPSFGVNSIPRYQVTRTKKYLRRFQFLSVREETGKNIVRKLVGKEIPVVVDPTLLLDREKWEKFENTVINIPDKYIFCYFLGDSIENRKVAECIKDFTGYKIIHLPFMDEYVKADENFGDVVPLGIGPKEFVYLIHHAQIICTDSFHGTVFSLIFEKQFYSMSRTDKETKTSTSSRIQDLLNKCHMEQFYIDKSEHLSDIDFREIEYKEKDRNWDKVQEVIKKSRKTSLDYLFTSIEGIRNECNHRES